MTLTKKETYCWEEQWVKKRQNRRRKRMKEKNEPKSAWPLVLVKRERPASLEREWRKHPRLLEDIANQAQLRS